MAIKKIAGVLAAGAIAAASAHASTCTSPGTISTASFACAVALPPIMSTNTIGFTELTPFDLSFSGATTSFLSVALGDITKGGSVITPFAFYETTGANVTTLDLSPGTYDFRIFGLSLVPGANLNLAYSVSAVPEAQTLAMLLAGLAVMGVVIARRKA